MKNKENINIRSHAAWSPEIRKVFTHIDLDLETTLSNLLKPSKHF